MSINKSVIAHQLHLWKKKSRSPTSSNWGRELVLEIHFSRSCHCAIVNVATSCTPIVASFKVAVSNDCTYFCIVCNEFLPLLSHYPHASPSCCVTYVTTSHPLPLNPPQFFFFVYGWIVAGAITHGHFFIAMKKKSNFLTASSMPPSIVF